MNREGKGELIEKWRGRRRRRSEILRELQIPRSKQAQELDSLATRRRQIVQMGVAEKNRLQSGLGATREDIRLHLEWF